MILDDLCFNQKMSNLSPHKSDVIDFELSMVVDTENCWHGSFDWQTDPIILVPIRYLETIIIKLKTDSRPGFGWVKDSIAT